MGSSLLIFLNYNPLSFSPAPAGRNNPPLLMDIHYPLQTCTASSNSVYEYPPAMIHPLPMGILQSSQKSLLVTARSLL